MLRAPSLHLIDCQYAVIDCIIGTALESQYDPIELIGELC